MPKFSVILPSYLGEYKGCATGRDWKLKRAIESVLKQSFGDFELLIICDGCEQSYGIACDYDDERIDAWLINKQPIWTGLVRNFGLQHAKGDVIVYLDSDDFFGVDHLKTIAENIGDHDWVWFNDLIGTPKDGFKERDCHINVRYQHGTSNVAHKRSVNVKWTSSGYSNDDLGFIEGIRRQHKKYTKIQTPAYHVCHLPQILDI